MHNSIKNIAFAGAGNVAWHLAKGLQAKGYQVKNIWSRDYANALALAGSCGAIAYNSISELREEADLIIVAVADDSIADVARSIGEYEGIVVHTAGSVHLHALKNFFKNCGVFYPLQTFSKGIPLNLEEVPFFLEASSDEVLQLVRHLALNLSAKVYEADSEKRMLLHVAAVFAGNYSNLMYIIGDEILKNSNLPPDLMHPLITETTRKALSGDPLKTQTGPARRHDTATIEKHLQALAALPDYAELYRLLARLISNKY